MAANDNPEPELSSKDKDITLAELLDTPEFVRCDYCNAVFTTPLLLPCLHTFCQKCIERVIIRENLDLLLLNKERDTTTSDTKDELRALQQNGDISSHHGHDNINNKNNDDTGAKGRGVGGGGGGDGNNSTKAARHIHRYYYTFNCPTCLSRITIEEHEHGGGSGGGQQQDVETNNNNNNNTTTNPTEDTTTDDEDTAAATCSNNDAKTEKTTMNGHRSHSANDDGRESSSPPTPPLLQPPASSSSSSSVPQSVDISPASYQHLQRAIRHSLQSNHFVESVTRLYRYRKDVGRECAYCKTEDVVEAATCLCLQCDDDVCEACAGAHRKTRITRDHTVVPYTAIQQGLFDHDIRKAYGVKCQEHPDVQVTHFCHECLKVVCKHCCTKRHPHHTTRSLTVTAADAAATTKLAADIRAVQEGLSRRVPDLAGYIQFLTQQLTSLQQRHRRAADQIHAQVQLVHQMLDEWRDNILSDMDAAVSQERKTIQDKIHNFRVNKSSTEKSASFLLHLCNLGKADEKLGTYGSVMTRYQQLIRTRPKPMASRLGISFTTGPATGNNIRILIGQMGLRREDLDSEDTEQSRLPITSLMPATLDTPVRVASWTISSGSTITNSQNGTNGQSSKTSSPCFISGIDIKGNLMAAVDRRNGKIIILDYASQKVLKEFTGSGSHKLKKPFDVVFLPSGALAVTDPEASAVKVFDWTGKFLFTFDADIQQDNNLKGCKGNRRTEQQDCEDADSDRKKTAGGVRHPRGITVAKTGEVVVVDGHFRHCTVHDSNTGKILRTIYPHKKESKPRSQKNRNKGSSGSDEEENIVDKTMSNAVTKSTNQETEQLDVVLVDPFYICTTQDGNLVITDAASPNVKILSWPSGELLQESLNYGIRQEECLHPAGVCVDHRSGYMLLVDTNNNRIHLGLPDGHFTTILIPSTATTSTSTTTTTTPPSSTTTDDTAVSPQSDAIITTTTTIHPHKDNTNLLSHPTCLCLDQQGHIVVGQVGGKIDVFKYL